MSPGRGRTAIFPRLAAPTVAWRVPHFDASNVTLHAVVALIAVFLQAASAGVMFFIARAPGWERVRLMAAIALTAGFYSAVDVWFYSALDDLMVRSALVRLNLFVAGLHAAMWMRFTFADATGQMRSMPAWTRWVTGVMLAVAAVATGGDLVLDYDTFTHVQVPWLGLDERTYAFNGTGDGVAAVILSVLFVSLVQHLRRSRRGEPGAFGIVVGLTLYVLCIVEEALVASGQLPFMYLGSPGYVFAVLPLTIQLLTRFGDDARRLADLSARLSTEVEARTVERDEARESLLEQQRLAALGRLAAGVGHEINNPLQYLVFQLEELRSVLGPTAPVAARSAIEDAMDGARRIGRVVTSLRTYGARQVDMHCVALNEVVRAALRIAAPQVRHEGTLQVAFGVVPDVMGDEGQLVQMLVNPLVNAAQALAARDGDGHEVTVTTRTGTDGWAEVVIADNGPGFDPAVLPQLGEPYVTTRARTGGTGLGLFVTRGLAAAHGGTFELSNRPEGGAQVRLRLPPAPADEANVAARRQAALAEAPSAEAPSAEAVPDMAPGAGAGTALAPSGEPARVLVVDDEPVLRLALERLLSRMGHHVAVAEDGRAALAMLQDAPYDVVVSDLMMPHMSGAALADRLTTEHPELRRRLVVMTGGAVTAEDEAFLARPDLVVVNKPVGATELARALTRALATPLLALALLGACASAGGGGGRADVSAAWRWPVPSGAADTVRSERLAPGVRLHHLVGVQGPWRGAALEVDLDACVSLRAVKGSETAVGRRTTSALLQAAAAAGPVIGVVNADFFSFTPPGVPTGAHIERGQVLAGPGTRPVLAVDAAGRVHLTTLRADGWLARGRDTVPLAAWNRWPAAGVALLDGRWGVALDTALVPAAVALVPLKAPAAPAVPTSWQVVRRADAEMARGDTVLLVTSDSDSSAAGRQASAFLSALRVGDTVAMTATLLPFPPVEAVGGFPWLVRDSALAPGLAQAGAESFRGLNPRTAVGLGAGGRRLWLVVVDGRQPGWSMGLTTEATASLLRALGATEALNLDGGGSSVLAVWDATTGGPRAVTRPSDAGGERAVGNALVVSGWCG